MLDYCPPPRDAIVEWCEPEPSWSTVERSESQRRKKVLRTLEVALVSSKPTSPAVVTRPLAERFHEHAEKWGYETAHLSSPTQMMMHPSYLAILGMAQENKDEIVRLMLGDLQQNRRPWFWALSYLTNDNPIKQTDAGKLDKMIKSWIDWGKWKGIR